MKKQFNDLPTYEILINESEMDNSGIRFISLVDDPAIQVKGLYFKKENCKCNHEKFANYDEGKLPHPNFMVNNLIDNVFKLWDENESYDAYSHPNCNCFIDNKGEWNVVDEVDLNGNVYPCDICLAKKALWDASERKQQFVNLLGRKRLKTATKKFESDLNNFQFSVDNEKQIICGPALIPNFKIFRKDNDGEYYVFFTEEVIRKMVSKFNKGNNNRNINVDHSSQMVNAYVQQNWIIEDTYYDKSKLYGFDLPVGTWFVEIKVEDKQFWEEQVKGQGKYSFSIEGLLGQKLVKMQNEVTIDEMVDNLTENEVEEIINMFKKCNPKKLNKEQDFIIEVKKGETEEEFISRCIGHEIGAGHDQSQSYAICKNIWDNR